MNQVIVKALMIDPVSNIPVVILKDTEKSRLLPIWLGNFEANAIAMQLENLAAPRPMTHDLLNRFLQLTGAKVLRVVVSDLRDSTFYAEILIHQDTRELCIDARPSDAIAIALRASAPIFVAESVFQKIASAAPETDENQRKLHALVDRLSESGEAIEN